MALFVSESLLGSFGMLFAQAVGGGNVELAGQQVEFLGVPLFDDDLMKLVARLFVNLLFLLIVVGVYYKHAGRKDYLFTYCTLNVLVFFICFTLKKFELDMGMALGLFAIFGVLRYRTDPIPIREMSYLFIVIGLAVINSLSNRKVSYAELMLTNCCIVGLVAFLENLPLLKQELRQQILYEKIELIQPQNHQALLDDLQERTGLSISRVELGQVDFLRDTVMISAFYYPHEQVNLHGEDVNVSRKVPRR